MPEARTYRVASKATDDGMLTEAHLQSVGSVTYFDAAGFPGFMGVSDIMHRR